MKATEKKSRRREFENLALPVILLLTGFILIGGDCVGVLSLDRIQNLWPVAFILVGLSDLLVGEGEDRPSRYSASEVSRDGARRG